jgi:DNA-directed RNA polymerase specialized sigma24 family protein
MERFWGEVIPERPKKADPRIEGLMNALGDLRADKRAIIQKYYIKGKSVALIAEEMWLSKSATQS